jgi:imidazolonepropionase-like amidohydrolase
MNTNQYIISHANLVDVENDRIMPNVSLEVKDGIIVKIADYIEYGNKIKAIDLHGKYLIPGLINLHVHLFGSGFPSKTATTKGKSQEKLLKFVDSPLGIKYLRITARKNVRQELLSGCTTIRCVGDINYADVYVRDQINLGKFVGPRMYVAGFAVTTKDGHGVGSISKGCQTKEEFISQINKNLSYKTDLVKICVTGGVMDATKPNEPGEVKMNLEQTKWCVDEAHKNHLMIASHTESTEGVRICLKAGVDTIEHGAKFDGEILELFKKSTSVLITTISPALPAVSLPGSYTNYSNMQIESSRIVFDGIIAASAAALKNGITVGLGTDASCPFSTHTGMWRELCYFHKYVGASNQLALKTATLINARIIHIDNITGSIKQGKSADMIVTDNNPYDDLKALRKIDMVIICGKIIKHPIVKKNRKLEKRLDSLI